MKTSVKLYNKFLESCGESEPDFEKSWWSGFEAARQEILKTLGEDVRYGEISYDVVDKIEEL